MNIGITSIKTQVIEDLLEKKTIYELPYFQREFSWTKSEWNEFIDDAFKAMENNDGHFFGFMTFKIETNGNISIIEGQQRLSTITIIISVIRDILFEDADNLWESIDNAYIKISDPLSIGKQKYNKLKLSELNGEFFIKKIQLHDKPNKKIEDYKNDEKRTNQSNKLIFGAYKYFYDEILKRSKDKPKYEKQQFLREILGVILRKFVVITTEVTDEKAAYNIFQTLNNRGLDLTLTDLVKVYLFRTAGNKWSEAKDKWDEIRENLNFVNPNAFFRHYWLSSEGIVKETELLKEIEKKIRTESQAFKFLENLKSESECYEALLFPTKEYWGSKEIVNLIDEMQILSKQSALPLLLSISAKFKDNTEKEKSLRIIIDFIFRYLTVAEWENKNLERLFSDIALAIRNNEITDSGQIRARIKREDVPNDQFILMFATKEFKKAIVCRYIFRKIEHCLDLIQEIFSDRITLEHIIPRNPDTEWKDYLQKNKMDKDDWIYRLGNMTILLGKINKKLQNKIFTEKFEEYRKSSNLKVNEPLKIKTTWIGKDIDERQEWLAELANDIWKI